jgi:hypothetical protein
VDLAAQDALGQRRVEARVQALRVGVPHVELGALQRFAVLAGDAPGEHDLVALLVVTTRQLERRLEHRRPRQVVRAEDRALRATPVLEDLGLDGVLDEHVEEQRPLAGLTHVDEPLLRGLELLVGDVVLVDRGVDAREDVADQQVGACGVGHEGLLSSGAIADGCRASAVTLMSMYGNSGRPLSSSWSSSFDATSKMLALA